jgi:uncharacterized protein (DUF305 family)
MRTVVLLIVAAALAIAQAHEVADAATASKPSPKATATPNPTLSKLSKLTGRDFDAAALRELLPRFEEDIEIAYAATLNADHAALLQWNQRMIDRKSQQTRQMLALLGAMGVPPGRRGVGVVTPEVTQMRQLKGAPLERRYLTLLAQRFEHNVAVASLVAERAALADLRTLAGAIARVERQEIAMLKQWFRDWYGR